MCPIFTISYTRPFLLNLYYGIINEHNASDLSKLIILLPDQNSVLELKKIFRNKYKSACFLPKILALSDYRNIAKTFKLKLDYKSNEDRNLIVRGNLLNFISKLSYVELEDKIIIVQDLLKLFSELHQAGSDFNQLDLAFLGKSKDEQILYSILNDFKKLIIKKNFKKNF